MKKIYIVLYLLFVCGLAYASYWATNYVDDVLMVYEESQPEKILDEKMKVYNNGLTESLIEEDMIFPEVEQLSYDKAVVDFSDYKNQLLNAKEFSYGVKTGNFSETGQQYYLYADDEPVAVIAMESLSEKIELGILKIMDWEIDSITPFLQLPQYQYTVNVPDGSVVTINNTVLTEHSEVDENGWVSYASGILYGEPTFSITDPYGCETYFDIEDNVVTPIIHEYSLQVPTSFEVFVGNKKIDGIVDSDTCNYTVKTAYENLLIKDSYGNEVVYDGSQRLFVYNYEFTVPSNFGVTIGDLTASDYIVSSVDNPAYKYCAEYVDMPTQVTYKVGGFIKAPEIVVKNNAGNIESYDIVNGKFTIIQQEGIHVEPEELKDLEPLELAKKWSLFMTNDLGGDDNGFSKIKKYLIKDSYMYKVAKKWTTGIDITLTSAHRASDNYFTDEKVYNFIKYSDNVYSFNVSFVKHMYLYKRNRWVDDEMNSTFYVMKTEDGDWVILDIQEIISVG